MQTPYYLSTFSITSKISPLDTFNLKDKSAVHWYFILPSTYKINIGKGLPEKYPPEGSI